MDKISQPPALKIIGDLSENWLLWKQQFDIYSTVCGINDQDEKVQCAMFLHVIGEDGLKIYNSFKFSSTEKDKLKHIIKKFETHCIISKNIVFERFVFFKTVQQEDQTFDNFVSELRAKSQSCDFGDLHDSLLTYAIVAGLKNPLLRERLLRTTDLSLSKAVSMCRASEVSELQGKVFLKRETTPEIEEIRRQTAGNRFGNRGPRHASDGELERQRVLAGTSGGRRHASAQVGRNVFQCYQCGSKHESRKCPAYGKKCFKCQRLNHFSKMCRSNLVNEISDNTDDPGEDNYYVDIIMNVDSMDNKGWFQDVTIGNKTIKFKLDSGAQVNVMSFKMFKSLGFRNEDLCKSNIRLMSVTRELLPVVGLCKMECVVNESLVTLNLHIVDTECNALLGLETCKKFGLIKRINEITDNVIVNKYYSVFEGLGCLPGEVRIKIDPNVTPVVNAPRKIPFKLMERLKLELNKMINLNVIRRINEPTEWVNSMVLVEKANKDLRICLDPRHLNKAIKRPHYQLPTIDNIITQLNGSKYFSVLDARSGFWMLKLDNESSRLCTFCTPYGRYCFLRLPFGLSCAPEVFQNCMNQVFDNLPGVACYMDDILVWGNSLEEHNKNLGSVLRRAEKSGIKFNREKCKFAVNNISFLGHILSREGIKPDPEKIKAIKKIPSPTNKKELERFLGMGNYLSKFISNYSSKTELLRKLLKESTSWVWYENHEKIFENLKKELSTAPVLAYFNVNSPIVLSVDASSYGLGSVLLQNNHPIAYSSRVLTTAEQNYAQIEKELLAIQFACKKFHHYIYGQNITVETDHKPLLPLFSKPLHSIPMRLQRMMLSIQIYNINITHVPGKYLFIADALSRSPLKEHHPDNEQTCTLHVNLLIDNLPLSNQKLEQIMNATNNDNVLQSVVHFIKNGWPNSKENIDNEIKPYWRVRDELNIINKIIFRSNRIVIPKSLQTDMLKRIHEGHLGIVKCKSRARELMYWPEMNNHIENLIKSCPECLENRNDNQKENIILREVTDLPWERVSADIFTYKSLNYLLVIDSFSKYIETVTLPNLRSQTVIKKLKSIFSRHGIPKILLTDNGTQFTSAEFKMFCQLWEFEHQTSSPTYPQSNGMAERGVQTVKNIFKRAQNNNEDIYLGLLNYRTTPLANSEYSPAQLLMSRRLNCRLPISTNFLKPKNIHIKSKKHMESQQNKTKLYYNQHAKDMTEFNVGDRIRFKEVNKWVPGLVISKVKNCPRSYMVQSQDGSVYRRNRIHLLHVAQTNNKENNKFDTYLKNIYSKPTNYVTRYGREIKIPERYGSVNM